MERLLKGLIVAFAVISPLYLYGVNEGYSVITESSPWGIVMGKDKWEDLDDPADGDSLYELRLDSRQSCGLSCVKPNNVIINL
ncbi:hypothetical protein KAX35_05760 [candidate division WOR-3 bacterium]|nr:hypothetical protein [candidate division WOR-3 bacterium]